MKQWIRWSGLAAFIGIMALVAAFFLLAAGPLIKMAVERLGSQAAGAKVEVGEVSLSLLPLGFTLENLTVADARKPMQNAVEFSSATAEVELAPLFLGKGIIRELSVDNLQFGTARTTSGALEKSTAKTAAETAESGSDSTVPSWLSGAELPSAEEILARESLQTESAGKALESSYAQQQQAVDSAMQAVPDDKALAAYEKELQALTSGSFSSLEDFKQRKQKLDELKARFKQDKAAVAAARQAVATARTDILDRLQTLRDAPENDLAAIRSKYQLNTGGAANMTALLFGDQAGQWAEQALYWYEKIKPYLASDDDQSTEAEAVQRTRDGRFVHFPSSDPWPDFLLRNAHMTAVLPGGRLLISADDVTHQPAVLGRPAHIVVNGAGLRQVEDLTADIVLDHRKAPGTDTLTLTVKDWQLQGMNLGLAETRLDSALVQVQGLAVVKNGQLDARADARFGAAVFSSKSKTTLARELSSALAGIERFDVNAGAAGKLTSPEVTLGSDLDKQLSSAFSRRLQQKQAELEAELQAALRKKVQSYSGDYADEIRQLTDMDGSLQQRTDKITDLADARLEDYQTQKEREAKEASDRKKKELQEKAKDKLKSLF